MIRPGKPEDDAWEAVLHPWKSSLLVTLPMTLISHEETVTRHYLHSHFLLPANRVSAQIDKALGTWKPGLNASARLWGGPGEKGGGLWRASCSQTWLTFCSGPVSLVESFNELQN